MRRTSFGAWVLLAAIVAAIAAVRLGRAVGPIGIVLAVVLVVVALWLVRDMIVAVRAGSAGPDGRRSPPKNVTPHEPALPPGPGYPTDPIAPTQPSIVVVEPPDSSGALAAKLQALDGLRADGLISEDEYEAKRARLIADF